jgi:hypothetical protein
MKMQDLRIGETTYRLSGTDGETALAHALGRAFIGLQQLEYSIISFLNILVGGTGEPSPSFNVFASKTFGNLVNEMRKHTFLERLANEMRPIKEKRDFFIHKFLFHRYGGPMMTTDPEYEALIRDAHDLGHCFFEAKKRFEDFLVNKSSIAMFVATVDPVTGEMTIRESEALKGQRKS